MGGGNLPSLKKTLVSALLSTFFAVIPASQTAEAQTVCESNNNNNNNNNNNKTAHWPTSNPNRKLPEQNPRKKELKQKIRNNNNCIRKCKQENTIESGDTEDERHEKMLNGQKCHNKCHKTNPIFDIKLPNL